ncbi:hypothetical protein FACS1894188_05380 [Clostridia bacterium]|nr:hypothetical protein FACS1894188_05380 [Clostridia bacterium]
MRMCFGVYAKILTLCTPEFHYKVLHILAKTVSPQENYELNSSSVTRILRCETNLTGQGSRAKKTSSKTFAELKKVAEDVDRKVLNENFRDTVLKILDEDRWQLLVVALQEVVDTDEYVGKNPAKFKKYNGVTKEQFLKQKNLTVILSVLFWRECFFILF